LDFSSFVITGPSTLTATAVFSLNGAANTIAGVAVSLATQCLTDTFSVTGYTSSPPVICGTNTGYHSKPSNLKKYITYLSTFQS